MKNAIRTAIVIVTAFGFTACALKTKILDTAAISMTRGPLEHGERIRETGPVSGEFCMTTFSAGDTQGLLDESVKSAQTKYGVDYLINATFWRKSGCITVEGSGGKLMAASVAAPPFSGSPRETRKASRPKPPKTSPKSSGKSFKKTRRG
ncbi:hypothetical protein BH10BDE1_BH10BDE1_04310 [soil metagenome]